MTYLCTAYVCSFVFNNIIYQLADVIHTETFGIGVLYQRGKNGEYSVLDTSLTRNALFKTSYKQSDVRYIGLYV